MPDRDRADALQSLGELRDEFLGGVRHYPCLYHVLVQAADESHPMLAKLPPLYEERLGPYLGGKYGTSIPARQFPSWRHRYFGHDEGLNPFRLKAARAAKHLIELGPDALGQPAAIVGPAPPLSWEYRALWDAYGEFSPGHEAEFWLLVVHHLGWQRGVGEKFSARREIWAVDGSDTRWYELPYEPEALAHYLSRFEGGPPECLRRFASPTDYFFSVLSDDVFSSSKDAIDMILEPNGDESESGYGLAPFPDLSVDPNQPIITLGKKHFSVTKLQAEYVRLILAAKGEWTTDAKMKKASETIGSYASRLHGALPKPIRDLIKKQPGAGQRLKRREVE